MCIGEGDSGAEDGDTRVFVEGKTRKRREGGACGPLEAFTPAKQARLRRAVAAYLERNDAWDAPCRMDLACVSIDERSTAHVEYYRDVLQEGDMY